jgi:hypothetical protein
MPHQVHAVVAHFEIGLSSYIALCVLQAISS